MSDMQRDAMTSTYCCSETNSTRFTRCCGVAASGDKCPRCGRTITHHEDSPAVRQARELRSRGRCGMCGRPIAECYC